jgi:hypothetical protein
MALAMVPWLRVMTVRLAPVDGTWRKHQTVGVPASAVYTASDAVSARYWG